MSRKIYAADLFCGAGGFSTGLLQAADSLGLEVDLLAINHWPVAVSTHSTNHPTVRHLCESIETVKPREVVPGGKLHLLMASPQCTHFSTARGGRPMSDQQRASSWRIMDWLDELDVENVIIENVPEYTSWGPLYPDDYRIESLRGRPIPRQKGKYFRNFIQTLKSRGYRVDWRILNAADYGAATTRKRFFLLARKGRRSIVWPDPTHARNPDDESSQRTFAFTRRSRWRPAREIIDWDLKGESIYERARPLSPNTMARIYAGLRKFSGLPFLVPQFGERPGQEPRCHSIDDPAPAVTSHGAGALVEPFLVVLRNHADGMSLDEPMPTLCASGTHVGLAEPFLIGITHGGRGDGFVHSTEPPLPTLTTQAELALAEPFLVSVNHGPDERVRGLDGPLPTLTGKGTQALVEAVAQPFMLGQQSGAVARSVEEPAPTVAGAGAISLVEPYLVNMKGRSDAANVDLPAPTITAHAQHLGIAEPFLVGAGGPSGSARAQSLEEPLGTVLGENHRGLAEPYLVEYRGNHAGRTDGHERVRTVEEPLPTQDTSNRFALAAPFLVEYFGTGQPRSLDEPLPTGGTRDRFALVHPELVRSGQVQGRVLGYLDIRFRMLKPHELAGAMSFPRTYRFTGTQEQVVKQIGNAVDVKQAEALTGAVLRGYA